MYRLWAIIRTEFRRQLDGPTAWLFFLILPLLFTAVVGTGLRGVMNDDEAQPEELQLTLYVVQEDTGALVDTLLDALEATAFNLNLTDALPDDSFGLIIPADFSSRLLAGDAVTLTFHTLPESNSSPVAEQSLAAAQGRLGGAALVARAGLAQAREAGLVTTPEEEAAFFTDLLTETLADTEQPPAVAQMRWPEGVEVQDDEPAMASSVEHASAGQIVTWVQTTLLGAAEILIDERLRGTLQRMLIMPTSRAAILGGKLLASLLLGLVQIAILVLGGALLFGVGWGRAPLAVIAVSLAFAWAVVGLGLLLATLVKTRGQASSAVIGLAMTMAAMGGAWFPLEVTPTVYRQAVQILPSTWAVRAYEDILARGATFADVLPTVGVLLGFAILFTVIGVLRFNRYE